jgi:hypothetical protein
MTTSTLDITGAELPRPAWGRFLPGLGGLALVGGLIALLATPAGDESGETAAEVVAYAQSHEGWIVATALFALAALVFGAAFVTGLHDRLHGVATRMESTLVLIGGTVFTLCFSLTFLIWTAPLADTPGESAAGLAQAQAYLSYDDIGWFVLGLGGVAAAVMAVPASLAAIRAGLPAWLGWLGVVAGVASLGTVAFLGMFGWMAWIVGASVVLLVTRRA